MDTNIFKRNKDLTRKVIKDLGTRNMTGSGIRAEFTSFLSMTVLVSDHNNEDCFFISTKKIPLMQAGFM